MRLPLLSRKEFQVFKNLSFDPGATAVILVIAYFATVQNTGLSLPF